MTIEDWRTKIDEMDLKLVELINQRAAAAREIGKLKNNTNLPIYEPEREKKILEAVKKANKGPLPDSGLFSECGPLKLAQQRIHLLLDARKLLTMF